MRRIAVSFDVDLTEEVASTYNIYLEQARKIRRKMQVQHSLGRLHTSRCSSPCPTPLDPRGPSYLQDVTSNQVQSDLLKLMRLIIKLQQMLVCPRLAELGAAAFEAEPQLYEEVAGAPPTGSLRALLSEVRTLQAAGHRRIVIAANHVAIMRIAARWLAKAHSGETGEIVFYDGRLSQLQRQQAKRRFLGAAKGLLFLSIGAGGVGLHLVPGCEAMIFWGSSPLSPAHTRQALKRIHRIGQDCPATGQVTIIHLLAYGSVDYGIGRVHHDKERLIDFVQEGDESGFIGDGDETWRKYGRIVDECEEVLGSGTFPPMPLVDPADETRPFALLTGKDVSTRGRDESSVEQFARQTPSAPTQHSAAAASGSGGGSWWSFGSRSSDTPVDEPPPPPGRGEQQHATGGGPSARQARRVHRGGRQAARAHPGSNGQPGNEAEPKGRCSLM